MTLGKDMLIVYFKMGNARRLQDGCIHYYLFALVKELPSVSDSNILIAILVKLVEIIFVIVNLVHFGVGQLQKRAPKYLLSQSNFP